MTLGQDEFTALLKHWAEYSAIEVLIALIVPVVLLALADWRMRRRQ
ncbi:MAG: hypothetical protein ABJE10_18455 [bacterium]